MADDRIFDLLEKIYIELQETKVALQGTKNEVKYNSTRLDNLENELKYNSTKLDNLEKEVKSNSIKLESIETKLNTMAEIQKSHMEQNDKHHTEIVKPIGEKVDIIELAVKSTSKDIQDLKEKFDKVEKVTMQNTYDVAYLKSVK